MFLFLQMYPSQEHSGLDSTAHIRDHLLNCCYPVHKLSLGYWTNDLKHLESRIPRFTWYQSPQKNQFSWTSIIVIKIIKATMFVHGAFMRNRVPGAIRGPTSPHAPYRMHWFECCPRQSRVRGHRPPFPCP